jgi:hypothetical protein
MLQLFNPIVVFIDETSPNRVVTALDQQLFFVRFKKMKLFEKNRFAPGSALDEGK